MLFEKINFIVVFNFGSEPLYFYNNKDGFIKMIYRMDLVEQFDDHVFISIYDALEYISKTVNLISNPD